MTISDELVSQIKSSPVDSFTGLPELPEGYSWRIQEPGLTGITHWLYLMCGTRSIASVPVSKEVGELRDFNMMRYYVNQLLTVESASFEDAVKKSKQLADARLNSIGRQTSVSFLSRTPLTITDEQLDAFFAAVEAGSVETDKYGTVILPVGLRYATSDCFRWDDGNGRSSDSLHAKRHFFLIRVHQKPLFGGLLWLTSKREVLSSLTLSRKTFRYGGFAAAFRSLVEKPSIMLRNEQQRIAQTDAEKRQEALRRLQ